MLSSPVCLCKLCKSPDRIPCPDIIFGQGGVSRSCPRHGHIRNKGSEDNGFYDKRKGCGVLGGKDKEERASGTSEPKNGARSARTFRRVSRPVEPAFQLNPVVLKSIYLN